MKQEEDRRIRKRGEVEQVELDLRTLAPRRSSRVSRRSKVNVTQHPTQAVRPLTVTTLSWGRLVQHRVSAEPLKRLGVRICHQNHLKASIVTSERFSYSDCKLASPVRLLSHEDWDHRAQAGLGERL